MKNYIFALLLFIGPETIAQDTLYLLNPSFEKDKRAVMGQVPKSWVNLGNPGESPSDIQPGLFGVTQQAQSGKFYVGMVARDNGTWEGIGQRLNGKLSKDSIYSFNLWLATSEHLESLSRTTGEYVDYNSPVILKIWGVNTKTETKELLAKTEPILHGNWLEYVFTLKPSIDNFDELDLMVYYANGFEQQNGNLLLDNCSPIIKAK